MPSTILEIATRGAGLYEFTHDAEVALAKLVRETGPRSGDAQKVVTDGLLTVFVRHTSCSLVIQENADPDVRRDLAEFFERLVPYTDAASMRWVRHTSEGPDDMPAHIKAALTQTSIAIPVADGKLLLGTWQGIYLFEHRERAHRRQVVLQFLAG